MTIKQLKKSIEDTKVLRDISASYADVASGRFKTIRQKTEKNRLYLEELSQVFKSVKQVAAQKKLLAPKNGKTINIILTSNYQFYGDINYKLIKFFLEQSKSESDTLIIGKTGSIYLKQFKYASKFDEFILKKDFPNPEELESLVVKVADYSQILVYFSKLQSVILQNPTAIDITQTSYLKEDSQNALERPFIFEPEINKVLGFFETQVKGLLLQQTFLESELARTGARVLTMDKAKETAQNLIAKNRASLNLSLKTEVNSSILQTTVTLKALLERGDYDTI